MKHTSLRKPRRGGDGGTEHASTIGRGRPEFLWKHVVIPLAKRRKKCQAQWWLMGVKRVEKRGAPQQLREAPRKTLRSKENGEKAMALILGLGGHTKMGGANTAPDSSLEERGPFDLISREGVNVSGSRMPKNG